MDGEHISRARQRVREKLRTGARSPSADSKESQRNSDRPGVPYQTPEVEVADAQLQECNGRGDPGNAAALASRESAPWDAPLIPDAYHGPAGELVRVIEPASEAHPAALLFQTLTAFGSMLGRGPHFMVEGVPHFPNEFAVLVGPTAKARKGTSWGRVSSVMQKADEPWAADRVASGLSSGEGLIWAVRDPIVSRQPIKQGGRVTGYEEVENDPGERDKRLLVYEPEFANVLKQTERQGNSLSAVLRNAWDGRDLRSMTKNSPARATGAHVSLIGHITVEELRRYLTATESANGFANRFLFVCIRRSKLLPHGGHLEEKHLAELVTEVAAALTFARTVGEVKLDRNARRLWTAAYAELSKDVPGMTGALLGRAEAHTLRLAMIYALLDRASAIAPVHLLAGLAAWEYADRSVRYIFGQALGDPLADEILHLVRAAPEGLSRTDLGASFSRHQSGPRLSGALALLTEQGLVRREERQTGGRPAEYWHARNGRQHLSALSTLIAQWRNRAIEGAGGESSCARSEESGGSGAIDDPDAAAERSAIQSEGQPVEELPHSAVLN